MKRILLFSMIAVAMASCTKSVQLRENSFGDQSAANTGRETTTRLAALPTLFAIFGDDRNQVMVKPEPFVICDSYQDGEASRGCNIYINFNISLSRPSNRYVRVEIERDNIVQVSKPDPVEGDTAIVNPHIIDPGTRILLVIPPNKTSATFRSALSNPSNTNIKENEFRIVSADYYTPVN